MCVNETLAFAGNTLHIVCIDDAIRWEEKRDGNDLFQCQQRVAQGGAEAPSGDGRERAQS